MRQRTAALLGLALLAGCSPRVPPPPAVSVQGEKPTAAETASASSGTATLGVWVRSLPERERLALEPPPAAGLVVAEVLARGPAAKARMAAGDVILAVDGTPVKRICDFYGSLAERPPGTEVRLSVQRRNATFEAAVTLTPASDLFTTSCGLAEAAGCLLLGGLQASPPEALALEEKACRLGLADACASAADKFLEGNGAQQNEQRAAELFERSCILGSGPGCTSIAYQYATGRGVRRDDEHAVSLFLKACEDLGDPAGCYNVGLMIDNARGIERDQSRALAAYVRGCEGGSPLACTNTGFLYEHGQGAPVDEARAADFYRRACEGDGCGNLDPKGCANLGLLYRHGQGVAQDKARAAELLQKGCDGGEAADCSYLADMLIEGEGIPKDETRATDLYSQACRGGHQPACEVMERRTAQ